MKTRTMTRTQAELLLAAVIIARSTSYVLTKVGLQDMGKFTLLAVRFLLAFAFLAALFRRLLHLLLFRFSSSESSFLPIKYDLAYLGRRARHQKRDTSVPLFSLYFRK